MNVARHGRGRSEKWNEISYDPNESIDPATGLASGQRTGQLSDLRATVLQEPYLELRDHRQQPRSRYHQANAESQPVLLTSPVPGGVAWFRAFDRPGLTGYGWTHPGELADNSITIYPFVPYPRNGKLVSPNLLNNGYSLTVANYPGYAALGSDDFPNGKNVPASSLKVGDVIEISPSFFSTSVKFHLAISAVTSAWPLIIFITITEAVIGDCVTAAK